MTSKLIPAGLLLIFALMISAAKPQTPNNDEIKQKIADRLQQRNELIKDYQCELVAKTISSTPRGDMKMETKFNVYFKSPDKRKIEFVEGKRGNSKMTESDLERMGRRGKKQKGKDRGREHFDLNKYLNDLQLTGSEKIDGVAAYKALVKIKDERDPIESATVWIDQKTLDPIKIEAELRANERLKSGNIIIFFKPIGPDGAWLPVKRESERTMIVNTPVGKMEIESSTTAVFSNYQFNVGLKDEIFEKK